MTVLSAIPQGWPLIGLVRLVASSLGTFGWFQDTSAAIPFSAADGLAKATPAMIQITVQPGPGTDSSVIFLPLVVKSN